MALGSRAAGEKVEIAQGTLHPTFSSFSQVLAADTAQSTSTLVHFPAHTYLNTATCMCTFAHKLPRSGRDHLPHWWQFLTGQLPHPSATGMAQGEARPATPVPLVRRGVRIHGVPQGPEMGSSEVSVRSHVAQKQKPIWPNACSIHILPHCPFETRRVTRNSHLHPGPLMTHLCFLPQKLPETPSSM